MKEQIKYKGKTIYLIITCIMIVQSCSNNNNNISEHILIDISDYDIEYKEVLNNDIEYIALNIPDSIYFGNINHIKAYGNYLFLHDEEQTKSLTIVDKEGKYINQLKKIGGGPGEYTSLNAFTFDEKNQILTIYDRSSLSILHYSFPTLKLLDNFRLNKYIMNMEYIDDNTIMIISENEIEAGSKYEGVMYMSSSGDKIKEISKIGNEISSIELSYPNTVIRISNNTYYAHPHELTTIYKMDQEIQSLVTLDFGGNKVPERYWSSDEFSRFQRALMENPKALWVQCLIMDEDLNELAFAFLFKNRDIRYFYHRLGKDSLTQIHKGYTVSESDYQIPYPVGSDGSQFISLLYAENVNEDIVSNKKFLNTLSISKKYGGYIILKYKP